MTSYNSRSIHDAREESFGGFAAAQHTCRALSFGVVTTPLETRDAEIMERGRFFRAWARAYCAAAHRLRQVRFRMLAASDTARLP